MNSKLIKIGLIISILAAGLYYWNYNNIELKTENEISKNEDVKNSNIVEENNKYIEKVSEKSNAAKDNKTNNKDENGLKTVNDSESKPKKEELKKETKDQDETKPDKVKPSSKEVEASIVEKYRVLFKSLKSEYELKLNNTINQVKEEYLSLSEEERSKQKFNLAVKYLKLGRTLESECDDKFYSLLDQMKEELKANNLKKDSTNDAEKQYKEEKSARQKQLLDKALKNT